MSAKMSRLGALVAAALFSASVDALTNVAIKACAPNQEQLVSCQQMLKLDAFQYECGTVDGEETEECFIHECIKSTDCLHAVVEGEADWAMADPLMLYFVNDAVDETPKAVSPIAYEGREHATARGNDDGTGQGSDYYAVALVRAETCQRNPNLIIDATRGWKSCHVRYGDLASWAFPVYRLMSLELSDGDSDVAVMGNFYNASCAASNSDQRMCTNCVHRDRCDLDDPFAGNDGVIDCLRTESGDIAFMDHFNALRAQADPETQGKFRLLCNNGCEQISDATRPGCTLGTIKPDVAFLRDDNENAGYIQEVVASLGDDPKFAEMFGGATDNKFFSAHTVKMVQWDGEGVEDYIGPLKEMLDAFQGAAQAQAAAEDRAADAAAIEADQLQPPPAQPSRAEAAPAGKTKKAGTPGWAVALTFFAALLVGIAGGMFIHKLRKPKSVDEFYRGDMDVANGGLPNTDPRMRDDTESSLTGGFPDTSDLPMPPPRRR